MSLRYLFVPLLTSAALAAPLFPPTEEQHWGSQSLLKLIQEGLLKGYPDSGYKGDRVPTRQELVELVKRLLERNSEAVQNRLDKTQLQQLAREFELDVSGLATRLQLIPDLQPRIQELERIKFYGSFESRLVAQSFTNRGNSDNDAQRAGSGTRGLPFLDYNQIVGASQGATLRPQVQAVIPVVDYRNGRSLVSGLGFTSLLRLGLKARIDEESEAGLEIAGFSSQGNQNIDAYFGVSGPYLANPWTLNQVAGGGLQGQNNSPFSRVVFERAWYENHRNHSKLLIGAFDPLRMDPFIYAGQGGNNNLYSNGRFPGFGIQYQGEWDLSTEQKLSYELFASRFGDGGNVFAGSNYTHTVLGGDLKLQSGNSDLKLNWSRFYDDSPDFSGPLTGLENVTNVAYLNSSGWSQVQWVNPEGYFALQRPPQEIAATTLEPGSPYFPNRLDSRPIAGWNGQFDNTQGITTGGGNFGSQSQNTYGVSGHHWLPLSESKEGIKFTAEYAHSDYKPNRNSGFVSSGNLARVDVTALLLEGNLNLSLQGLRVDPTYNPALFNASLLGIRFVRPYNFLGRFHLYDNGNYPQNRQGLGFKGNYTWGQFALGWKAALYQQTRTSLYDVRVPGGALGVAIPTQDVIGFSPGFIDPIFSGLAHPNLYGRLSANSFDAQLQPLEDPRGNIRELGLSFRSQFDDPKLSLEVNLERNHYARSSSLSPSLGGSQNYVNLTTDYAHLGLQWGFQESSTLRGGIEIVHAFGHHDPAGLYNGFANFSGESNFRNIDSVQTIPYIGFDQQLSKTSSWGVEARFYNTRDRVDPAIFAGPSVTAVGATANAFSWSGPQISTRYQLTF